MAGRQPFRDRGCGTGNHCFVWHGRDGIMRVGCAHCTYVRNHWEEPDEDVCERQTNASREQHREACVRENWRRRAA